MNIAWKHHLEFAIVAFTSILFILNPLPTSTIFVSLSEGLSRAAKKAAAKRASLTAFLVLLVFSMMGNLIFQFFGISLPAFRVAGGIIIFGIGYKMLRGKPTSEKHNPDDISGGMQREDFALVPLAIPMLSGPGAISTVMVLTGETTHWSKFPIIITSCALSCLVAYLALVQAEWISSKLGSTVIRTVNRIMGLLLCVISVQFVMNGLKDFYHNFLSK